MRRSIVAAILALAVLAGPVSADLSGFQWKARAPFTVTLVSEIADPTLQSLTTLSAVDWSESVVVDVVLGPAPKRGPMVRIVDGYYTNPWNALAHISNERGYITAVTIYLNRTNLDQFTVEHKQHTICQELGHSLGLDHQDGVADTCMGPYASATLPNARDFADLVLMYD